MRKALRDKASSCVDIVCFLKACGQGGEWHDAKGRNDEQLNPDDENEKFSVSTTALCEPRAGRSQARGFKPESGRIYSLRGRFSGKRGFSRAMT
jgi:hypothetical protein